MSYQVLARKWRPKSFATLTGQDHVVRALGNALTAQKLHHALLFTGTRGVGKTTIARIVAKSLNCLTGITANPCGECVNCRDIDAGRFPDLLEIDAASRTKVDDTRELLDSVIYAPSRGRMKVYLIDEVHMLSLSSFNALLKTLEEPPPHVQFVLATTDPQKLPVTVLSRCLKFHLKRLGVGQIAGNLSQILGAEGIAFEAEAIAEIARAADGSMRDGLSLLDQAIADGGGALTHAGVLAMLGTVARTAVQALLAALLAGDAVEAHAVLEDLQSSAPGYRDVVARMLELLHQLALIQVLGEKAPGWDETPADVRALAASSAPELVQLHYQLLLKGWREVLDAPEPRVAFAMLVLRLLAFTPADTASAAPVAGGGGTLTAGPAAARRSAAATPMRADAPMASVTAPMPAPVPALPSTVEPASRAPTRPADPTPSAPPSAPQAVEPARLAEPRPVRAAPAASTPVPAPRPAPVVEAPAPVVEASTRPSLPADWGRLPWDALIEQLPLKGMAKMLAVHAAAEHLSPEAIALVVDEDNETCVSERTTRELELALREALHPALKLSVRVGNVVAPTPLMRMDERRSQAQAAAEHAAEHDPVMVGLKAGFGARVIPGSVRPVG